MRIRNLATAVLTTAALAAVAACGGTAAAPSDPAKPLVVGASPVPHGEILKYVADNLAAKEGLKLEVKEFNDYVQPNLATDSGEIGANFFQHKPYLDDFATKHRVSLTSVAAVHIEPLGAYSKKIKKLDDLPEGATVAIPNDATNGGRALALLAANGVLKLKDGVGTRATERDVTDNPKKLKLKPLEAAQLPRSLDDAVLSVVNGNYALQAGLKPADALALEAGRDNPYANLLVVKKGNESDVRVTKLAKLLTSPEVKAFIESKYNKSVLPAF